MKRRKNQSAVKGRFSGMMISILIHVAVLIAAGTFVAVTVIQRQEARFEGRQVSRPRMQLQRLQVPQRVRQERSTPQMAQRVTAQAIDTRSIEFQMPEIAGLGGGIQVDMGEGFGGTLGFSTPQLNLFGLRSQGDKILFIVEAHQRMVYDRMGGIPAYEMIKEEMVRLIESLPATALFNVIFFVSTRRILEEPSAVAFSEELSLATKENIDRLREWIAPLNTTRQVGLSSLAWEGVPVYFEPLSPIYNDQPNWMAGLSYGLQRQVDTIFWLGLNDELNRITEDLRRDASRGIPLPEGCEIGYCPGDEGYDFERYPGGEAAWLALIEEVNRMHEEENRRRQAAGQPPRVVQGGIPMVRTYRPGAVIPTLNSARVRWYNYTPEDVYRYIEAMQKKHGTATRRGMQTGITRPPLTVNVVQFVPQGETWPLHVLDRVSDRTRGGRRVLQGLQAIRTAASEGR